VVNLIPDILFVPAILQLILGLSSLAGGVEFFRYVKKRQKKQTLKFEGRVTVFVPCRGDESGLAENLRMILQQDREDFEVILIVDSAKDPAVAMIEELVSEHHFARLLVAGRAKGCGQKVHNLIKGVEAADESSVAYVFADSDIRPSADWLRDLLAPLNEPETGCSTGYRWFVQETGGFATHMRASWNASIVSALGKRSDSNFAWGGSNAVRRNVFEELDIKGKWRGTVSDDFVITAAIRNSPYAIHFEPKCLTATLGDCSLVDLLEFTTRQMRITRVYSPGHFVVSLTGALLFTLTFFPIAILAPFVSGWRSLALALIVALIWMLGTAKSMVRIKAAAKCIPKYKNQLRIQYFAQMILWPFSSVLFVFNDLAALVSRKITWRGITYELVSDTETRILE